jgi:hypothetical protein
MHRAAWQGTDCQPHTPKAIQGRPGDWRRPRDRRAQQRTPPALRQPAGVACPPLAWGARRVAAGRLGGAPAGRVGDKNENGEETDDKNQGARGPWGVYGRARPCQCRDNPKARTTSRHEEQAQQHGTARAGRRARGQQGRGVAWPCPPAPARLQACAVKERASHPACAYDGLADAVCGGCTAVRAIITQVEDSSPRRLKHAIHARAPHPNRRTHGLLLLLLLLLRS